MAKVKGHYFFFLQKLVCEDMVEPGKAHDTYK